MGRVGGGGRMRMGWGREGLSIIGLIKLYYWLSRPLFLPSIHTHILFSEAKYTSRENQKKGKFLSVRSSLIYGDKLSEIDIIQNLNLFLLLYV